MRYILAVLVALVLPASAAAAPRAPRVPLPPVLTVHHAPCPDVADSLTADRACATSDTEVWISDRADRFDRWHEIGHVFDVQVLSDADRVRLTALLGMTGPWITDDFADSPDEFFADAYAACALRLDPDHRWVDGYGYAPTRRQHRRMCATIRRMARSPLP